MNYLLERFSGKVTLTCNYGSPSWLQHKDVKVFKLHSSLLSSVEITKTLTQISDKLKAGRLLSGHSQPGRGVKFVHVQGKYGSSFEKMISTCIREEVESWQETS